MHIEPGIVEASRVGLSFVSSVAAFGLVGKAVFDYLKKSSVSSLIPKSLLSIFLVFSFFQFLPNPVAGISEIHLIFGSTLFLIFGLAPAAIGLALGLLIQGVLFAPWDIPQYGINVTTLVMALFAMNIIAKKVIPTNTAYQDLKYSQVLKLSLAFQGVIVICVSIWAFYFQGFGSAIVTQVSTFAVAYMSVVLIEPVINLALLFCSKNFSSLQKSNLVESRLYTVA